MDIPLSISFIIFEDKWSFWKFEILWNREHLIIKPGDNRGLVIFDIRKMEYGRHLIRRKSRNLLKYTNESILECKIPKRSKNHPKHILYHLRIIKLIIVFISKYGSCGHERLESLMCRFASI